MDDEIRKFKNDSKNYGENDAISHWKICQLAVDSKESSIIKDLLYITDGIIPFLSQFSNVSEVDELTSIGENLKVNRYFYFIVL